MMGRHILTPEERARGHKLTRADCIKGGIAANRKRGAKGGRAAHAKGTAHALTAEERRKGGLATAAKRRAERGKDLIALALPAKRDLEPSQQAQKTRLTKIYLGGQERVELVMSEVAMMESTKRDEDSFDSISSTTRELLTKGASLAGKLMEPPSPSGDAEDLYLPREYEKDSDVDPFILSALKRFRLGPLSPLALTRSQRTQVDLMVRDGWLEVTGDSMLQLTSKGRGAIEGDGA